MRQMWQLLSHRERRNLVLLLVAMTGTALVQTLGISSVLPFLQLVANPGAAHGEGLVGTLRRVLPTIDTGALTFVAGAVVLVLLVGGNLLAGFTQYGVIRYSANRDLSLSKRLIRRYLARDFLFYADRNSTELARNVLAEVTHTVNAVLMPALDACSKGIVALAIVGFLLIIEPLIALLTAFILGGSYAVVYLVFRWRLVRLGRERLAANRVRYQSTAEAFASIKEIKVLNAEQALLKRFARHARRFTTCDAANKMAGRLPRFVLEAIAFGGVVGLLLYLIGTGRDFASAMPMVTTYAFAGYKLMPALQSVFRGITQVRFGLSSLEVLHHDLAGEEHGPAHSEAPDGDVTDDLESGDIELANVAFSYPNRSQAAISGITVRLPRSNSLGIVGETGSGKTTLVDIILGLIEPSAGELLVNGIRISGPTVRLWQDQVGYVPQHIILTDATVAENIAFAVEPDAIDHERVRRAARLARVDEFVERQLPAGYDTMIGERGIRLSGGQRQRVGIARALYRDPPVLVLDEATSALDSHTEHEFMTELRSLGATKTLIIIAHRLSTVRTCDRIIVLDAGSLAAEGTFDTLLAESPVFRNLARGFVE